MAKTTTRPRARTIDIETPSGTARVHWKPVPAAKALLVIGHGAGGGVDAPDIVQAAEVARELGISVALVEQPYRVAGRRSPAPAPRLDSAWRTVIEALQAGPAEGLPLIVAGRSMGARVACRTAADVGAIAVLCLAFPLVPPARKGAEPKPSRLPELDAAKVPTLVVQGERDPFGMPTPRRGKNARRIAQVAGDHGLKDLPAVRAAVSEWLEGLL